MKNERILIAYFGRGLGGIQMKILDIAYTLEKKGVACGLVFRTRSHILSTPVSKKVKVFNLGTSESFLNFPILLIRSAFIINQFSPTKVLAFADHTAIIFLILKKILFWKRFDVRVSEDIFLTEYLQEQKFGQVRKALIRWLYPSADRIVVLSEAHKKDLVANFRVNPKKIFILHTWPSPRWPKNKPAPPTKRDIDVLFVGRLEKQKRLSVFLQIINEIKKRHADVRAVIVGEGSQRKSLEQEAGLLGLKKNIVFAGYQKNPFPFYGRSKVFLLTSLYEGHPLVFLEAMREGTPILTFPYKGFKKEALIEGETGHVIKNIKGAVAKINFLTRNGFAWEKLSRSTKQVLKQKYGRALEIGLDLLLG